MKKVLALAYERAFDHVTSNSERIVNWASRLFEAEVLSAAWIEGVQASMRFNVGIKDKGLLRPVDGTASDEGSPNSQAEPRTKQKWSGEKPEGNPLEAKLCILRRNRDVLELQAASLGLTTPPHILTQLQDVKAEILRLEASYTENSREE
jgi:hypothetical protein